MEMGKKSRFCLSDVDGCRYIYDRDNDIVYFKDVDADYDALLQLLNNMNRELDYYKAKMFGVALMSEKMGTVVGASEERFKCKYDFPNYVMDSENTYGSHLKLLSIRDCCDVMNRLHNENVVLVKMLDGDNDGED